MKTNETQAKPTTDTTIWELGSACPECKLDWWLFPPAHCDERKPDGSFAPGPYVRCVNCKQVFLLITCRQCSKYSMHEHFHNTAYDIPSTYIAGSERFICNSCQYKTYISDDLNKAYPFQLDNKQRS